ncbi:MAG: hypothetical protein SF339_03450 [Blastocatellia bacterium]|nr:hypothetical protein [Blastocatellia bacterium]
MMVINYRGKKSRLYLKGALYLMIAALCLVSLISSELNSAFANDKYKCPPGRSRVKMEEELRDSLRTLRRSIDSYKLACEQGLIGPIDRKVDDMCYPPDLQVLVTGIQPPNGKYRIRFLRRIPVDPITGKREWGLRSIQDDPRASVWGGENVFDVYSKSNKRGLDKIAYSEW